MLPGGHPSKYWLDPMLLNFTILLLKERNEVACSCHVLQACQCSSFEMPLQRNGRVKKIQHCCHQAKYYRNQFLYDEKNWSHVILYDCHNSAVSELQLLWQKQCCMAVSCFVVTIDKIQFGDYYDNTWVIISQLTVVWIDTAVKKVTNLYSF